MEIVLYTKENCGYCNTAKQFLRARGISFKEMHLGLDFTREYLLENYPTATTYPVVVIDGFNIGGYSELYKTITEQFDNDNSQLLNEGEWNGN